MWKMGTMMTNMGMNDDVAGDVDDDGNGDDDDGDGDGGDGYDDTDN